MLKKGISLILSIALILSVFPFVSAHAKEDYIYLRVEGVTVSNDRSVKVVDGGYLVPLRQVSTQKKAAILWYDAIRTAEVTYGNHKSLVTVGMDFIYYDNEKIDVKQSSELINGSLYVGADVIETVFGLKEYYKAELSILDFVLPGSSNEAATPDPADSEYEKNRIPVVACEDTYIAGGTNADSNKGDREDMRSRYLPNDPTHYNISYVKFDISDMPLDGLNSVVFEGYVSVAETGSTNVEKWLYDIDPNSWEENTLTWNNKPEKVGELVGIAAGRSKNMIGVYITDYIKEKIKAGETMVSFMIEGEKQNIQVSALSTREDPNVSHRTKLVFDYNDPKDYKIFSDYPIPEYGKGVDPLENAKKVLKESTATYDYGVQSELAFQATEAVQVVNNDDTSYYGNDIMSVMFKDFKSNNITSYLKFDLSALDAKTVGGAYIQVYCTAASTSSGKRRINLRRISDNRWEGDKITYINAPQSGNIIARGEIGSAKTWMKLDVTDCVNEMLAKRQKLLSFALDAYDNYTTKFATANNKGYEPTLVIIGPGEKAGSKRPVFKDYSAQYDQTVTAMNPEKKTYENFKTRLLSSLKDYQPVGKAELSRYGGDLHKKYDEGTGFFRVEKIDGRWWFVDPEGYLMYSYGKCNVRPSDSIDAYREAYAPYGGRLGWTNAQIDYYDSLGFNSFGGWSFLTRETNEDMTAFVEGLNLRKDVMESEKLKPFGATYPLGVVIRYVKPMNGAVGSGVQTVRGGVLPVFNPDFEEKCNELIKEFVTPWKDNPYILGYWSDNEINEGSTMLDQALAMDPHDEFFAYTHAAAWEWLRERTGKRDANLYDVNDELREEFREYVMDRYYMIMQKCFKQNDPNHLYLGTRHFRPAETSPGIFRAAERYCDVISVNLYRHWTPDIVDTWAGYADKPIIITEWYARPEANVNMNSLAGGFVCKTSEDCGRFYQNFALRLLEAKNVVGFHFFTAVIGEEQENYMREFNPNVYGLIDYFDR